MYSYIKLNLYCKKWDDLAQNIKNSLIDIGYTFKELHNSTLLFSTIQNPNNIIIISVSSIKFLSQLESFAKECHDYQNRIFVVFKDQSLDDKFFINTCTNTNLNPLLNFLKLSKIHNLNQPIQPSKLLTKLVILELKKLQIPTKYIGFDYLTQLSVNYLCNTYSSNTYIELFEYVASINLASIDTIERDVRHMILTTWKNNYKFRNILQSKSIVEKPNSKNILIALLKYLKNTI